MMASLKEARRIKKVIKDAMASYCGIGINGNANIGYAVTVSFHAKPIKHFLLEEIDEVPILVRVVDRPKKMKSAKKK